MVQSVEAAAKMARKGECAAAEGRYWPLSCCHTRAHGIRYCYVLQKSGRSQAQEVSDALGVQLGWSAAINFNSIEMFQDNSDKHPHNYNNH